MRSSLATLLLLNRPIKDRVNRPSRASEAEPIAPLFTGAVSYPLHRN